MQNQNGGQTEKGVRACNYEAMAAAFSYVNISNTSVRQDAKEHGIPRATLQRHIKNSNKYAKGANRHFGRPTILAAEMENVSYSVNGKNVVWTVLIIIIIIKLYFRPRPIRHDTQLYYLNI